MLYFRTGRCKRRSPLTDHHHGSSIHTRNRSTGAVNIKWNSGGSRKHGHKSVIKTGIRQQWLYSQSLAACSLGVILLDCYCALESFHYMLIFKAHIYDPNLPATSFPPRESLPVVLIITRVSVWPMSIMDRRSSPPLLDRIELERNFCGPHKPHRESVLRLLLPMTSLRVQEETPGATEILHIH